MQLTQKELMTILQAVNFTVCARQTAKDEQFMEDLEKIDRRLIDEINRGCIVE
jgi:hypothetical protein